MTIKRICEDFFDKEEIDINMNDDVVTAQQNTYVMPTQYSSYDEMKKDYTFGMIVLFYCNALEKTDEEKNTLVYKLTKSLERNLDKCNSISDYSGFYQLCEYNSEIQFGEFGILDSNRRGGSELYFIPILFCFDGNFRRYSDVVIFKKLISLSVSGIEQKYEPSINQVQLFRTDDDDQYNFNKRLYWHSMRIPCKGEEPEFINALYERKLAHMLCGKDIYNDILKFIGFEITYERVLDDFKKKNKGKTLRVLSLPFRFVTAKQMQDFNDAHKMFFVFRNENYEIPYYSHYDYLQDKKAKFMDEYNEQHPDEKVIMFLMFEKRGTDMAIDLVFGYQHPILYKEENR